MVLHYKYLHSDLHALWVSFLGMLITESCITTFLMYAVSLIASTDISSFVENESILLLKKILLLKEIKKYCNST